MAQSVLPRTTPLLLFTLFPLMPTAVPRDPEKKVTFWLCCKGYFGKKPCREAHKVTLPYNQLRMTDFEDLRDQITQHVLDKHWPTGNPDSIKDSYEFGDLECWDKWDNKTRYVLPEPKQVTPGTSSSPEFWLCYLHGHYCSHSWQLSQFWLVHKCAEPVWRCR